MILSHKDTDLHGAGIILLMFNKLTQSQSTLQSLYSPFHNPTMPLRDAQSSIRNPYPQKMPLKFPKNRVRKQTSQHMLAQTTQNPQPYSVRPYQFANHSRVFHHNAPLTPSQKMSKHPLDRFDNLEAKRIVSPGVYHNLSLDSIPGPVRLRKYEDIGAIQNSKRSFQKMHYRPDPIITGQKELRHVAVDRVRIHRQKECGARNAGTGTMESTQKN